MTSLAFSHYQQPGIAASSSAGAGAASYYQTHAFHPYNLGGSAVVAPPPPAAVPPPPTPAVTAKEASKVVRRLISNELRMSGFGGAQGQVVERLEVEVVAFVERLYASAHEQSNLANRSGPIMTDLLLACEEHKLQTKDLRKFVNRTTRKRKRHPISVPELTDLESRESSPELLSSDDESVPVPIPITLRTLPSHYPALPPKHTYLRTPASPPKKAALPSLEKKLKTAGLVQESLRNLLIGTEDTTNQEDAELLGHIVNWEAGMHPRKRWKVQHSSTSTTQGNANAGGLGSAGAGVMGAGAIQRGASVSR